MAAERSLVQWLTIAAELKAVVDKAKEANADGKVEVDEVINIVSAVFEVLVKNGVTIEELSGLAKAIGPLLPLLKTLGK